MVPLSPTAPHDISERPQEHTPQEHTEKQQLAVGFFLVILSVLGIAHKGIFYKWLFGEGLDALQITALRLLLGVPISALIFLRFTTPAQRVVTAPQRRLIGLCVALNGFCMALHTEVFRYLPTGIANVLVFVYPLFIFIGQSLTHRALPSRPHRWKLACLLGGLFCIAIPTLSTQPGAAGHLARGFAMGILVAVVFSFYVSLSADAVSSAPAGASTPTRMHPLALAFWTNITYATFGGIWLCFNPPHVASARVPTVATLAVLMAVFTSSLPNISLLLGFRRLGKIRGAMVTALNPGITAILALLWLGEALMSTQIIGIGLIVCAAFPLEALLTERKKLPLA